MISFIGKTLCFDRTCEYRYIPQNVVFFSKWAAEKLLFQKIKNYHLVIWIHMNVGSFGSLQSNK